MSTSPFRSAISLVMLLSAACSPPGTGVWSVGEVEALTTPAGIQHVFSADLDGDGRDELGTVVDGTAEIAGQRVPLTGEFQQAVAIPGGATETVWLATGQGRANREAPVRVLEISAAGTRTVFERDGERDQLTGLRFLDGKVWATIYADGRTVTGGWLSPEGFQEATREHMAQQQVPLSSGATVVGRVYGKAPKSPGDLRHITRDGKATPLPSLRGVRSLARVDLDGDGHDDIVAGDGWHFAYGKEGDARVMLHRGPEFTDSRVIGWIPDSYAALRIEPIGSGAAAALVVQGSHRVVVLARDTLGWGVLDLGPITELGSISILDSESNRPRVAISTPRPRMVSLALEPR